MKFSVLMSVYAKEKPKFLRMSLDSILNQTRKPNEIVLVEDGLLGTELNSVIDEFCNKTDILKLVKLPVNLGLGNALNEGLKQCSYDYIARMDSDDICFDNRFEMQIEYLEKHPDIDVLGSWTQEFTEDSDGQMHLYALKKFPLTVWENFKYSLSRCPVEHPAVILRKDAVIKAGGYQKFYLFEDYYLWARMFVNGSKFANIGEPLLYFRMTPDSYKRRGGLKYAKSEAKALFEFYKMGFLSKTEYYRALIERMPVRLLPNYVRQLIYQRFLRRYT